MNNVVIVNGVRVDPDAVAAKIAAAVSLERERCAEWVTTLHPNHDITRKAQEAILLKIRSGQ